MVLATQYVTRNERHQSNPVSPASKHVSMYPIHPCKSLVHSQEKPKITNNGFSFEFFFYIKYQTKDMNKAFKKWWNCSIQSRVCVIKWTIKYRGYLNRCWTHTVFKIQFQPSIYLYLSIYLFIIINKASEQAWKRKRAYTIHTQTHGNVNELFWNERSGRIDATAAAIDWHRHIV